MRVYIRNEILKNLNMLLNVHGTVKNAAAAGNRDDAYNVLTECQKSAVVIGQAIEDAMNADEPMCVRLLEEYCDLLFEAGEKLPVFDRVPLDNKINEAVNAFESQNPADKLKVVFMPYKASMWDSLESIYFAAAGDPSCDAEVVPIPYYNLNSTTHTKSPVYEGNDFSKDIPVTKYDEYDLEEEHPDIIFIHNPWDNGNLVTQVYEQYFSKNLKKHCEKLVYVPYGIFGMHMPDSHLDTIAYHYVDYIVMANENLKKELVQHGIPEEKVLVLGSPKFDRVIKNDREKKPLPQEWAKVIGDRKLVFYNTSISDLLYHGEHELNKMKQVFNAFRGRQNVTLLWRPHPLLMQTIVSMRPKLLDEFNGILELYRNEPTVILDETPDMDVAVSHADAYIGDGGSSLVTLFGVAGKPVFILNQDIKQAWPKELRDKYFGNIFMIQNAAVDEHGNAYYVNAELSNAVIKTNQPAGTAEIIGYIPEDTFETLPCISQYATDGKKLYMGSGNSVEVAAFDFETKETRMIFRIPTSELQYTAGLGYAITDLVLCGDFLFAVTNRLNMVFRLDLKEGKHLVMADPLDKFGECNTLHVPFVPPFFADTSVTIANKLFLACTQFNAVIELNMDNGEAVRHTVGSSGCNYAGMMYDGTEIWLIPNKGSTIVRWNPWNNETAEYYKYPNGFVPDVRKARHDETGVTGRLFWSIADAGDAVIAFPMDANMAVKINKKTGKKEEFKVPDLLKVQPVIHDNWSNAAVGRKISGNSILILPAYADKQYIYDTDKKSLGELAIPRIEPDELGQSLKNGFRCYGDGNYYYLETLWFGVNAIAELFDNGLADFNREVQLKHLGSVSVNLDGTSGKKIYEEIKQQF